MLSNGHLTPRGVIGLPISVVRALMNALDRLVSTRRSRGQIVLALAAVAIILVLLFAFTGLADWTDTHSTTIQGLAIIVLALTTALYMLYTRELVVRTSEQRGPHVFFEVARRGAMLDSVIRNSGERAAENVRLTVQQDVEVADNRGFLGWPLFQERIPFLPPGRSISQPLTNMQTMGPRLYGLSRDQRVIRYTISYTDGVDEYEHSFSYDLSFLTPVGGDPFPLAGNYVAQLTKQVETLTRVVGEDLDGIKGSLHSIKDAISRQARP